MTSYLLYLNGKPYGRGSKAYILELIEDHLVTVDMYGAEEAEFLVKRIKRKGADSDG